MGSVGLRRALISLACLASALGQGEPVAAQPKAPSSTAPMTPSLDDLLPYKSPDVMVRALQAIEARRDRTAIPALIELLRFELPIPADLVAGVLEGLSGQRLGKDWGGWVEWLQKRTDIAPLTPPRLRSAAWLCFSVATARELQWCPRAPGASCNPGRRPQRG